MRIGHGFDAHQLLMGRKFVLGGVHIPFDHGPVGHSDGDVLAHAIADALLGACALGDLGAHFPSSDERWRDADSLDLLARCLGMVRESGYELGNVDATIVVEHPALAPYLRQIRDRLAEVLGASRESISVKAKTTDGMGYTGDGTGIAAYAVAVVNSKA
ncbi:MAG: 2-C-methyl-D-erythritol 2,4-cyclodiphosphate synthase [Candidatus Eremiobacteraeota bacterium]|nr:2-C-methyl-D-erythritol 2,4-cyclodiphosphate synthase [Candidatus Eremiobacteraeota bacterium]